jgi:uncharacterized iron-regulated protein
VKEIVHGTADPSFLASLGLDAPLPEPLAESLKSELAAAHCGHLPESMIEPMMLAQRAKDHMMATRMVEAGQPGGAVLIAGGGHVRTDRGVPMVLREVAKAAIVKSVAFEERDGEEGTVEQPYDFVWWTARKEREDPCARLQH